MGRWLAPATASLLVVLAVLSGRGRPAAFAQTCPEQTVDISGSGVPDDVEAACQSTVDAFDHYSWKAFLSVTRAAAPGTRGAIDTATRMGAKASAPLVFERYKALWEVFNRQGSQPIEWSQTPPPSETPCPNADSKPGDLILSSFSKLEDVQQIRHPFALDGPLIAQNGTAIRYATAYNEKTFGAIRTLGLYRSANLGQFRQPGQRPAVEMPEGSIAVKSAWMILTSANDRSRYHWRKAWVRDLGVSNACTWSDVALVGLHVIQKTHNNPQWIWTSFEHVDNLSNRPRAGIIDSPDARAPFALHDATADGMPAANPNLPGSPGPLQIFNVTRRRPILNRTQDTNRQYAAALAKLPGDVVWQHYRLVVTQWPRATAQPQRQDDSIPGGDLGPFAFAFNNPAFETFFQSLNPGKVFGCMNCHNNARDASDYLWTPVAHAADR